MCLCVCVLQIVRPAQVPTQPPFLVGTRDSFPCVKGPVREDRSPTRSVNKVMRLPAYRTIWQYCGLALHMKVR